MRECELLCSVYYRRRMIRFGGSGGKRIAFVVVMEYVSIVVNNGGGRCVGYMQTLGLSDAIAFEKGQDSADPCLEPQVITMMSVSWMVVM